MTAQRCKYCGRFFVSACPHDEFCGATCQTDDRTDRELVKRLRDDNLRALYRMAREATRSENQ